jgi:hypothetical protein
MRVFLRRLVLSGLAGLELIALSLYVGMAGYRYLEGLSWLDSFMNAAMILAGMGPVATIQNAGAKLFAGLYALYSGLALILITGIVFGPVVHRLLHYFHLERAGRKSSSD